MKTTNWTAVFVNSAVNYIEGPVKKPMGNYSLHFLKVTAELRINGKSNDKFPAVLSLEDEESY